MITSNDAIYLTINIEINNEEVDTSVTNRNKNAKKSPKKEK